MLLVQFTDNFDYHITGIVTVVASRPRTVKQLFIVFLHRYWTTPGFPIKDKLVRGGS